MEKIVKISILAVLAIFLCFWTFNHVNPYLAFIGAFAVGWYYVKFLMKKLN